MRPAMSFRERSIRFLALSLALHLVVSTVAFYSSRHTRDPIVQAEIKYYPVHLYLPGGIKAKATAQPPGRKKHPQASRNNTSNLALNTHLAPPAGAPVSTPHEAVAGNGADAESANPAFPVFSPRPPVPDRSLLPPSSEQVVVDVKVSANGD